MNPHIYDLWVEYQNSPVDLRRIDLRLNEVPKNLTPQDKFAMTCDVRMRYNEVPYIKQDYEQVAPTGRTLIRQIR